MWRKGTDIALRYVDLSSVALGTVFTEEWISFFKLCVVLMQVNPELKSHFEEKGFRFVGQDVEGERMEVIELDGIENTTL